MIIILTLRFDPEIHPSATSLSSFPRPPLPFRKRTTMGQVLTAFAVKAGKELVVFVSLRMNGHQRPSSERVESCQDFLGGMKFCEL